ncbi:MAG TPA: hypothetical protein DF480_03220 [Clostridiales bacterium]|nr:hypothetical protein [Clostridiales bacterium]
MSAKKTAINITVIISCMIIVLLFPLGIFATDTVQGEVLFNVSEPDPNGIIDVSMSIRNATFNTYQFALKYNTASIKPIDLGGNDTTVFQSFATRTSGKNELAAIGTSLDTDSGLIEFAGYVMPGNALTSDGLQEKSGYAVIGSEGLEFYRFRFQKISNQSIGLELATMEAGEPYAKSLPDGGALFNAGVNVPITIRFKIPASIGTGSVVSGGAPAQAAITKAQRLQNTIALQIGNYGAAANGALVSIDPDNPDVRPYIDDNDRTMMPVRFIAERLGAAVEWNGQTNQVTIRSGDRTIVMTIGSKTYTVNGVVHTMDTEPIIVQGWNRTVVPIRFVSEALGRAVEWDAVNRLVLITDSAEPWQKEREAEQQATQSILFVISDLVRDFT